MWNREERSRRHERAEEPQHFVRKINFWIVTQNRSSPKRKTMKTLNSVLNPILLAGLFFGIAAQPLLSRAETQNVVIFAAASTSNAVTDIIARFSADTQIRVVPSFASSSTLAKQIESGAPADLFLSADEQWMDYLADRNLIQADSRINLLGNRIVLIAPTGSNPPVSAIKAGMPLRQWLGDGRLAMGDPAHTPVGIYGQKALESLGLWEAVKEKLAPAKDVRAALTLVERGEAPLGIVYATDAAISAKVRIVGAFPETGHPLVVYPVALVADRQSPSARLFLAFLRSAAAKTIFEKYGFSLR
jgi:molybdate transport system substrate-binding protein